MSPVRALALRFLLAVGVLAAFAQPAAANLVTYHVAPAAAGLRDCSSYANPCTFAAALTGQAVTSNDPAITAAAPGDTIDMDFGTYVAPSGGFAPANTGITIDGGSSAATVIDGSNVTGGGAALTLTNGSTVSDLRVNAPTGVGIDFVNGTTGNRLDVRALTDACAETLSPVVIDDSLCLSTGTGSQSSGFRETSPSGFSSAELNNDTLSAAQTPLRISVSGSGGVATVTNTAIYARTPATPDCSIQLPNSGLQITFDHSAYPALSGETTSCKGATDTITETAPITTRPSFKTPVDAGALFSDFATADYREQTASSTRAAGVLHSASGTTDLDGQSRTTIDNTIDVGAYERFDPPTVTPLAPAFVTTTTATIGATVNNHGVASSSTVTYGASAYNDTILDAQNAAASFTTSTVTNALTGLQPGTTYQWQVCSLAGSQDVCTPVQQFTTQSVPLTPPTVGAATVLLTSDHGAIVSATVDLGGEGVGSAHVEYGTTTAYGSVTPDAPFTASDTSTRHLSPAISGLQPGTTYHARFDATNDGGTTVGADFTFHTTGTAPVTTPTPTVTPSPTPSGTSPVTGTGGSTLALLFHGTPKARHGVVTAAVDVPSGGTLLVSATYPVATKHKGKRVIANKEYAAANGKPQPRTASTVTVTLKPSRTILRALAKARSLKLTIVATFTPTGGKRVTTSTTLTVKP